MRINPAPFIILLFAGAFSSCKAPSSEYHIGLYGVPAQSFKEIREAGFNLIVIGGPDSEMLESAKSAGLQVIASSGAIQALTNTFFRNRILKFDQHPALFAWYLFDEPDLHRVPPSKIRTAYDLFNRISKKPGFLVVKAGQSGADYTGGYDILGVDSYPVPWAPLAQFDLEMHFADLSVKNKPFYAIVQAFDWAAFPNLLATDVPLRPPTEDELRCMVYLALANGARGIIFYTYAAEGWFLPKSSLWPTVKRVAGEVRDRGPLFTAERLWWSPQIRYIGATGNRNNSVGRNPLSLTLLRVREGNRKVPPGAYVLAINTTGEGISTEIAIPQSVGPHLLDLKGNEITVLDQRIVVSYPPYAVACYGPLPVEAFD